MLVEWKRVKLESLGISLEDQRINKSWETHYNDLCEELKQAKKDGISNKECLKRTSDYYWIHRQKNLFNKGKLSKSRSQKLKKIGIKLKFKSNYEKWLEKFYYHQEIISSGEIINKVEDLLKLN